MIYRGFLLYLFILYVQFHLVLGSSHRPPPLKRVAPVEQSFVQITRRSSPYPERRDLDFEDDDYDDDRRVRHTDSIRITLHALGDKFHLHLRPNDDLIHPAASVKHFRHTHSGSVVDRVEPLRREKFLVFGGEVVDDKFTDGRLDEDFAGGIQRPHNGDGHRGWARIMVLSGGEDSESLLFEGAFSVNGVIHHVLTKENYLRTMLPGDPEPDMDEELVIFRDIDMMTYAEAEHLRTGTPMDLLRHRKRPQTCSHDKLPYNVDEMNPVLRFGAGLDRSNRGSWFDPLGLLSSDSNDMYNQGLQRRQGDIGGGANSSSNFVNTIGQTTGCPKTQQIIYMGVVADCAYTQINGGNANATQNILRNFNTVSLLYKSTFNISLGIVDLQISDQSCPSNDTANPWNIACGSTSLNDRLSLFSAWRGQKFDALSDPTSDPTGLWHLMSGCPSGTEVGVAWLGTVCQKKATGNAPSVVSGTGVSTGGRTEWQVIAHEIGHNLGAIHDCTDGCSLTDNCCPLNSGDCNSENQFLMNPTSSSSEQTFSQCTIGNICSLMQSSSMDTSCIKPPNQTQRTFSLQMCGNGIVESGEECDPGAGTNSTCCDQTTCKFKSGAVCDPSSSACCTDTCQFASSGVVCRPAKDAQCDVSESCTGTSAECPADKTAPNGQSCGSNGLACANGACTSVSQQCQTVGASLNLTTACPSSGDSTCQVSCQDPSNPSQCIVLNSQLVDGSPCGYGGTCYAGNCRPGTFLQAAASWYTKNLQISIPVSVVVALLLLLISYWIFTAIRNSCSKRKPKVAPSRSAIPPGTPGRRLPSWAPGMPVGGPTVAAGPFAVPPQRLNRLGSGSSGSSAVSDSRRPSNSSDKVANSSNPRTRPQYAPQPSYSKDASQKNVAGVGRRLMEDRTQWVDEREYNGPRG